MTLLSQDRALRVPADHSLSILVARDVSRMSTALAAWTRSGLLRPVIVCQRDDLALSVADINCASNVQGNWSEMRLSDALRQKRIETLAIAVLRPWSPSDLTKSRRGLENEILSLERLQDQFKMSKIDIRSLTVSLHDDAMSVSDEFFSPQFDMHLIHDADSIAHRELPVEEVQKSHDAAERLTLCVTTALTMCGAWRFSPGNLIETDSGDAALNPVRVVRPQVRIVFAGRLLQEASTGLLPLAPPWPLPSGSGTVRAQAGAVPPPQTAEAICKRLGFELSPVDPEPQPRVSLSKRAQAAWYALTQHIVAPDEVTGDERALDRLRDYIVEGAHGDAGQDSLDSIALRKALERSGLSHLVGGAPPEPVRWDVLREFAFCLVDGGELSDEVARYIEFPVDGDGRRLVWNDPNSIIPSSSRPRRAGSNRVTSMGATDEERLEASVDDSLFQRIRSRLDDQLRRAAEGCAGRSQASEQEAKAYEAARSCAAKLRRVRNVVAGLVLLAAFIVIERWFGIVGSLTDLIGIGTIGGKSSNPTSDVLVGVVVSLVALTSLTFTAWRASIATLEHYDAQRLRRWRFESGRHHAVEATRLCAASIEFDDHAEIVATMLHRPYSTGQTSATERVEVADIPHPSPLLVASASPLPEHVATMRRQGRTETAASGWIGGVFASVLHRWRDDYSAAVAGSFDHPDTDHTPPGVARHRDSRDNEPMLGPREHIAHAIRDDNGLRREITYDAVSDLLSTAIPTTAEYRGPARRLAEMLGTVTVPSARALNGLTVAEFLNLSEESNELNWRVLRPGSKPPGQIPTGHQAPFEIPEGPGQPETLVASLRVLMSHPFSPTELDAWVTDDSAGSADGTEPEPTSVV